MATCQSKSSWQGMPHVTFILPAEEDSSRHTSEMVIPKAYMSLSRVRRESSSSSGPIQRIDPAPFMAVDVVLTPSMTFANPKSHSAGLQLSLTQLLVLMREGCLRT